MKNLIQAAVVILFAASAAQAQQAVQWKVSDGGNGHWYRIVNLAGTGEVSWQTSRASALSAGGDLATFTSAAETAAFLSLTAGQVRGNPWIGLFQDLSAPDFSEPAGGWRWASGEDLDWTNWAPGEPNNADSENWANMWIDFGPPGKWNDYRPTNPQGPDGFIVEWSADCNGDGIVDYGQCRDGSLPDHNGNNVPDCCETGVPCGSGPPDGDSVGFLRLGRSTDTVALSASPAYGSESTHEFRIRFPTEDQPGNGRLWSEQNGMETDRAIGFGTFYAAEFSAHFGQCCQAPLHVVTIEELLDGQWHHVAMVRAPDEFRLYVDGMLRSVQPSFGQAGSCGGKCPRSFGAFRYSYTGDALTVESIIADLDWIAISSSSRYSGNSIIVPCESDVMADESTKMLFKFNEVGETTIVSEAGAIVGTLGTGFGGATEPRIVYHCQPVECAKADIVGDGFINGLDLGMMLGQWGPANPSGTCDINLDGVVDSLDLGVLLSFWGPCTN